MKLWSQKETAPWEAKGFPNSEHLEEVPPSLSGGRGSCMKMDNSSGQQQLRVCCHEFSSVVIYCCSQQHQSPLKHSQKADFNTKRVLLLPPCCSAQHKVTQINTQCGSELLGQVLNILLLSGWSQYKWKALRNLFEWSQEYKMQGDKS